MYIQNNRFESEIEQQKRENDQQKRENDQQKRENDQQKRENDQQKRVIDQQKREIDQQKREIDRLQKNTYGQQSTKLPQPKQLMKLSAKQVGHKTESIHNSYYISLSTNLYHVYFQSTVCKRLYVHVICVLNLIMTISMQSAGNVIPCEIFIVM